MSDRAVSSDDTQLDIVCRMAILRDIKRLGEFGCCGSFTKTGGPFSGLQRKCFVAMHISQAGCHKDDLRQSFRFSAGLPVPVAKHRCAASCRGSMTVKPHTVPYFLRGRRMRGCPPPAACHMFSATRRKLLIQSGSGTAMMTLPYGAGLNP
jgi:hypothetical protein